MQQDRILPFNQCSSVYLKPEPVFLDKKLFDYVTEPGVDAQLYETYFKGDLSENYKIICKKYHPHRQTVSPTPSNTATSQYSEVPLECRVKKIPKAQRPRNALTVMLEEEAARQTGKLPNVEHTAPYLSNYVEIKSTLSFSERKMKLKEQDEQKSEEDVLDTTLELQDLATGSETTSKRDDETVSPEKTRTNSPSELSKVERAKVFTGSTKHVNFDSPGEKNKSGEKKGPDFHNSQTAGRSRPLQLSDILDSDEVSFPSLL